MSAEPWAQPSRAAGAQRRPVVSVEVLAAGTQTTVQDLPGRQGLWAVGVPPSGAWDDLSFALANLAVGHPGGAAGPEAGPRGPPPRLPQPAPISRAGAAPSAPRG